MSPECLLRQFDAIVDAPNGPARLRELILELAVRGRLVQQNPRDEAAPALLERVARERQQLFRAGAISKPKPLPGVPESARPFNLPDGWTWARLGAVTSYPLTDGDWVESKDQDPDGDVRLVQLADVGDGQYRNRSSRFLSSATAARLNCTQLEVGDVLIARLPNPLGRACVFPGDARPCVTVVDVAIARCGPNGPLPRYVMHAINSACVRNQMYVFGTGTTRFRISTGNISTVLFPVPPREEQDRVSARVDELLALCDELEARQQRRAQARATANRSLLRHLADANHDVELAALWQSLRDNFGLLYNVPETVADLRHALLRFAVQGRLVLQDPRDEPVSLLLERIDAEKEHLFVQGKIRKPKALSPIDRNDVPYAAPVGWEWVRLGRIGDWGAGATPKRDVAEYFGGSIPWLKSGELNDGFVSASEESVTESAMRDCSLRLNAPGDVLIAMYGATIGKVGLLTVEATTNQAVCACTPSSGVYNRFLYFLLRAYRQEFTSQGAGGAQPNISKEKIIETLVLLPPTAEQHRIVAKLQEMLALCDRLEAQLARAQEGVGHLAASVIHHLFVA